MVWGVLWMIHITRWWVGKKNPIFYENQKNLASNSNKIHRCLRKKLEMFVIRVNQMGDLVNSKPCNTCIYYMQLYGIKSVYIVPNGQAIAHVPQPVHSIFALLRIPVSCFFEGIFSSALFGQALTHGAESHLRQINAKRIISKSESNPLFSGWCLYEHRTPDSSWSSVFAKSIINFAPMIF